MIVKKHFFLVEYTSEVGDEILSGGVWRRERYARTTGQDAASAVPGWASCGRADGRGTWRLAEKLPSVGS